MNKKNTLIFIDHSEEHSLELLKELIKSKLFYPKIIICKKDTPKKIILNKLKNLKIDTNIFFENNPLENLKIDKLIKYHRVNTGFIFSFPFILKKQFIKKFKFGLINFHPAILPEIKGSHSSFWTIFREKKIGCSIHFIDSNIDSGPIIDTLEIKLKGLILADKVFHETRKGFKHLLKKNIKKIWLEKVKKKKNKNSKIYFKKDIKKIVNLDLRRTIKIKKLFNLLRATHFNKHGIFFNYKSKKYKLIPNIKEISK